MNIIIQVLVFSILIALTAVTYLTVLSIRQKLSCTTGMMAAMLIGSMTGLITGTVLGADQSFSINCMLAMIVGVGGGVMLGMPFHAMAVLDGLMAGVMSGMDGGDAWLYAVSRLLASHELFLNAAFCHRCAPSPSDHEAGSGNFTRN